MRRILTILLHVVTVLLLIAVLLGAGGYVYLRESLPQADGTISVHGLRDSLEVIRDQDDVPHIYARDKHDALFGLGYVHAQDRLWQMEFQRRIGQGRLSEVLGPATLPTDKFIRTMGIYRTSTSAWQALPPDAKDSIAAYVAGINAFLSDRTGRQLPPEFTILRITPELWTGPDVLAWSKMMAFNLGGDYSTELMRRDMAQKVGSERAQQLLPDPPETGPSVLVARSDDADYSGLLVQLEQVQRLMGGDGPHADGLGSNGWVVDGTKSATGKPILANDPHLALGNPILWYVAHLSAADLNVAGATIPGLPAVVIGQNQSIAWGVTNMNPDVQDLFQERVDASGRQAEFQGRMEPMQIITETIKVQGQPDVQQVVRITRHGPIISDALDNQGTGTGAQQQPRPALALRWTALDPTDTTIKAFLDMNQAQNWNDFTNALRSYIAPTQNFIYADVAGHIGYYGAGRIPIRAHGANPLPTEGWSGSNEWVGWIPFDKLPNSYDPPQHFIATANNRPAESDYPYFLGREWPPIYRAQRIIDLLQAKPQLTPDDFAAMQGDIVSLQARELVPLLIGMAVPQNADEQHAVALLRSWDGDMRGNSAAAALYAAWYRQLPRAIVGDELGTEMTGQYLTWSFYLSRFLSNTLKDRENPWCNDVTTAPQETCADVASQTLHSAIADLKARLGPDMDGWRWDKLHSAEFPHQPFDNVSVLRPFFSRSIPNGGDGQTLNPGSFSMSRPFLQRVGSGYRQIIDLANTAENRFIEAGGQSGHFLSAHYDDYLADWQAVRYRELRLARLAVERDRVTTLRLIVAKAANT